MRKTIKINLLSSFFILSVLMMMSTSHCNACTSVCVAKNGHVVFGNNLDWYVADGYIFINKRNVQKRGLWFNNPPVWVSKYARITVNQDGRAQATEICSVNSFLI